MSVASVLAIVGKIVDLVVSVWPKRNPTKPKPPKFAPIKITPKKPLDPYEKKKLRLVARSTSWAR